MHSRVAGSSCACPALGQHPGLPGQGNSASLHSHEWLGAQTWMDALIIPSCWSAPVLKNPKKAEVATKYTHGSK